MAGIGMEIETNKGSACIRNGGCQEEVKEKRTIKENMLMFGEGVRRCL